VQMDKEKDHAGIKWAGSIGLIVALFLFSRAFHVPVRRLGTHVAARSARALTCKLPVSPVISQVPVETTEERRLWETKRFPSAGCAHADAQPRFE